MDETYPAKTRGTVKIS